MEWRVERCWLIWPTLSSGDNLLTRWALTSLIIRVTTSLFSPLLTINITNISGENCSRQVSIIFRAKQSARHNENNKQFINYLGFKVGLRSLNTLNSLPLSLWLTGSLKQILSGMRLSRGVWSGGVSLSAPGSRATGNWTMHADADVISDVLTRHKLPVIRPHHLLIVSLAGKLPQNIKCSLYGASPLPPKP